MSGSKTPHIGSTGCRGAAVTKSTMASQAVALESPEFSIHNSSILLSTVDETKRRSSSITKDDTMINYTSMMGMEDRKRRFSEDVVDMELKDSERVKKLFRQIQRQVHCSQESKEGQTVF